MLVGHLSRKLQANLVAAMPMTHQVLAQLAIGQHDVTEVEGSCSTFANF